MISPWFPTLLLAAVAVGQKPELRQTVAVDLDRRGPALGLRFSADGQRLVTWGERQDVFVRDARTLKVLMRWQSDWGDVEDLLVNPDGTAMVVGKWIMTALAVNAEPRELATLEIHDGTPLAALPGGDEFVHPYWARSQDWKGHFLVVRNATTLEKHWQFDIEPLWPVRALAASADGEHFAVFGREQLWIVNRRKATSDRRAAQGIERLLYLADGRLLALRQGAVEAFAGGEFPRQDASVVAVDPSGQWLVIARADGAALLLDGRGRQQRRFAPRGAAVVALAVSPGGAVVAVSYADGIVRVFAGDAFRDLDEHRSSCDGLAFSRDSRHLAVATSSTNWFVPLDGKPARVVSQVGAGRGAACLCPGWSGAEVLVHDASGADVWDAGTGTVVRRLSWAPAYERDARMLLSPNESTLAVGTRRSSRLCDLEAEVGRPSIWGTTDLAWLEDGRRLVTLCGVNSFCGNNEEPPPHIVIHGGTGEPRSVPLAFEDRAFSAMTLDRIPGGERFLVAGNDGLLDVDPYAEDGDVRHIDAAPCYWLRFVNPRLFVAMGESEVQLREYPSLRVVAKHGFGEEVPFLRTLSPDRRRVAFAWGGRVTVLEVVAK